MGNEMTEQQKFMTELQEGVYSDWPFYDDMKKVTDSDINGQDASKCMFEICQFFTDQGYNPNNVRVMILDEPYEPGHRGVIAAVYGPDKKRISDLAAHSFREYDK